MQKYYVIIIAYMNTIVNLCLLHMANDTNEENFIGIYKQYFTILPSS